MPKPRVNLTRSQCVFAPNNKFRAAVTPAKRGNKPKAVDDLQERPPAERRASMRWEQRLKRAFNIDIEPCRECGGAVKVVACIEDPVVIKQMRTELLLDLGGKCDYSSSARARVLCACSGQKGARR